MATFILFDYANLIHRCKHVSNSNVEDTVNFAIHITLQSIRQAAKKFNADHVMFAMEGYSWRRNIYPEYKAQRRIAEALKSEKEQKNDKVFFDEMREFGEFLETKTNVTVLRNKQAEADDMIARWIQIHPDDEHIICSSDSDYNQLLAPNVKIFNAMKGLTVTLDGIYDDKGKKAKQEIKKTIKTKTGNKKVIKEKVEMDAPDPGYELFKKIIRGDISDNISTAYPKVREKGSSKKPGIQEAYSDMTSKGYFWNAFMMTTWDKTVDLDDNGDPIIEKVKVKDIYELNKTLIDLTQQPEEIKQSMDETILEAVQKTPTRRLLLDFMQLLGKHELNQISKNPEQYIEILAKKYNNS